MFESLNRGVFVSARVEVLMNARMVWCVHATRLRRYLRETQAQQLQALERAPTAHFGFNTPQAHLGRTMDRVKNHLLLCQQAGPPPGAL